MANVTFHDISYAQGAYNMDADPYPVVAMKMSGFYYGSKVGYLDTQAARNYNNAIRTGKTPILYHFAGGANPIVEADYFVAACSPLAEGDILALDYELTAAMNPPADPNNWCLQFCERVHDRTGIWPLFYTYTAMQRQYGFQAVLQNCGFWQANYGVSPDADIPGSPPYIIQQYTSSPIDTNVSFISLSTLKQYAYHAPKPPTTTTPPPTPPEPTPQPDPTPVPVPPPTPVPDPTPTPPPPPTPDPLPTPEPTPQPEPTPSPTTDWKKLIGVIVAALAAIVAGVVAWIHS